LVNELKSLGLNIEMKEEKPKEEKK